MLVKLQVIKDLCGYYIQINAGKLSRTTDIHKAKLFADGKAQVYIDTQIKKSDRDSYMVETVDFSKKSEEIVSNCISVVSTVNQKLHNQISPICEELKKQLQECDNNILDFRHYMRDKNTVLNAVQLCKAAKLCQELERKREAVKKELARCNLALELMDNMQDAINDFEYAEYNKRGNIDFEKIIKGREEKHNKCK